MKSTRVLAVLTPVLQTLVVFGLVANLTGCLMVSEDKTYQALTVREKDQRYVYKLYPGSARSTHELAIILMGDVPTATVDGLEVQNTDYQVIHLLPGSHTLSWRQTFGFSVMVEPAMTKSAETILTVNLQAGHTYKLFAERTYGQNYSLYFWIQDAANNEVVGGRKKP